MLLYRSFAAEGYTFIGLRVKRIEFTTNGHRVRLIGLFMNFLLRASIAPTRCQLNLYDTRWCSHYIGVSERTRSVALHVFTQIGTYLLLYIFYGFFFSTPCFFFLSCWFRRFTVASSRKRSAVIEIRTYTRVVYGLYNLYSDCKYTGPCVSVLGLKLFCQYFSTLFVTSDKIIVQVSFWIKCTSVCYTDWNAYPYEPRTRLCVLEFFFLSSYIFSIWLANSFR